MVSHSSNSATHLLIVMLALIILCCCALNAASFQLNSMLAAPLARAHESTSVLQLPLHPIIITRLRSTPRPDLGRDADRITAASSFLFSTSTVVVLWSESSIYLSSCGPLQLPDIIERTAYWMVLLVACIFWFCRVAFQQSLVDTLQAQRKISLSTTSSNLVRLAEAMAFVAVLGAIVALSHQILMGAKMDGLSGIDEELCRTRHEFQTTYR